MPPKKSKEKPASSGDKRRDITQAVVVADSFNFRFLPITLQKPRALLPLANQPLINYTLEFLLTSGIEEIIVVCQAHASQVSEHIEKLKSSSAFQQSKADISVVSIGERSGMTAGDCLRELERQQLIRSDFVLVSGDVVSNVNIRAALEEHKARRAKSKTSVMTLLVKKALPGHRTRCKENDVVIATDPTTRRLLYFHSAPMEKKTHFPCDVLRSQSKKVEYHFNIMDCHISICSPEVPQLFTDNFDYSCRDDFIKGVLVHEEITGHQIHVHTLQKEYAARVSNLQSYDAISKDIMGRWTYPVVPDMCLLGQDNSRLYSYKSGNKYMGVNLQLSRSCDVHDNTIIGPCTVVGENTVLKNCVIGTNCQIGNNVTITGAYLWDNVVIEDGCTIEKSIICTEAHVLQGVTIGRGCLLSYRVRVGPDIEVPEYSKVTTVRRAREDNMSFSQEEPSSSTETTATIEDLVQQDDACLGEDSLGHMFVDEDDDGVDAGFERWVDARRSTDDLYDGSSSDESGPETPMESDDEDNSEAAQFYREVLDSVQNAMVADIRPENLILEINGSKHAYNMTIDEIPSVLMKSFLMAAMQMPGKGSVMECIKKAITKLKPVLQNYIRPQFQLKVLEEIEIVCLEHDLIQPHFIFVLSTLYNMDLLEEDAIVAWHTGDLPTAEDFESPPDSFNFIRKKAESFINWLENASEESGDDDDDEEEEE